MTPDLEVLSPRQTLFRTETGQEWGVIGSGGFRAAPSTPTEMGSLGGSQSGATGSREPLDPRHLSHYGNRRTVVTDRLLGL